jgi:hypothetical protein
LVCYTEKNLATLVASTFYIVASSDRVIESYQCIGKPSQGTYNQAGKKLGVASVASQPWCKIAIKAKLPPKRVWVFSTTHRRCPLLRFLAFLYMVNSTGVEFSYFFPGKIPRKCFPKMFGKLGIFCGKSEKKHFPYLFRGKLRGKKDMKNRLK